MRRRFAIRWSELLGVNERSVFMTIKLSYLLLTER